MILGTAVTSDDLSHTTVTKICIRKKKKTNLAKQIYVQLSILVGDMPYTVLSGTIIGKYNDKIEKNITNFAKYSTQKCT